MSVKRLSAQRREGRWSSLGKTEHQLGHYEKATKHAEEAAAIYRSLADRRGEAEALDRFGMIHGHSSGYLQALAYYQEARGAYRSVGDRHGVADTLLHAGIACWSLGRPREAITQLMRRLTSTVSWKPGAGRPKPSTTSG